MRKKKSRSAGAVEKRKKRAKRILRNKNRLAKLYDGM
jgi:hypothetical protein